MIAMPEGCSSSSVLRVTNQLVFVKSTMMRSLIVSGEGKESKKSWLKYAQWLRSHNHAFKERKIPQKFNYAVEKSLKKEQRQAVPEEAQKQEERYLDMLLKWQTQTYQLAIQLASDGQSFFGRRQSECTIGLLLSIILYLLVHMSRM